MATVIRLSAVAPRTAGDRSRPGPDRSAAASRFASALRAVIGRQWLSELPDRQLRDIGVSRADTAPATEIGPTVLRAADRRGTSLLYLPGF